ncbi:MAG: hypothetical protein H7Y31_16870 [Chitinophagaceae bacterium]|nr:hypothetical protein [Chitinophagaceae bacterium]
MKRMILLFTVIIGFYSASGQSNPKPPQEVKVLPIHDVSSIVTGIVSVLKSKLALSDSQGPQVSNVITDFINKKVAILPLAKTDPAGYRNKFGILHEAMTTEFNTFLSGAQYSKLLGLKPRLPKNDDLLSHLFF